MLANFEEKDALEIVKDRLNAGDDPLSILDDHRHGMEIFGERFASGEYFIPDLGELLK
jgi:methanogenic corrinoid protein MtbC1